MTKKQIDKSFEEHGIKKLSANNHHRVRTEMYLGSRSSLESNTVLFDDKGYNLTKIEFVPSLLVAFREIFDNCIDAGIKNKIQDLTVRVDYDPSTLTFCIQDNSGGMPIDYSHSEGKNLAELLVSNTMMGSNFNDEERTGAGVNGLGGSVVCSVSKTFSIEIIRSGQPFPEKDDYTGNYKYTQTFYEPNQMFPEMQIGEPKITKIKSDKCGTTVKFQLSPEVFKNRELPQELVCSIIHEIAACNTDYKFYFNGARISYSGTIEKNLFKKSKPIVLNIQENTLKSTFYVLPSAFPGEAMVSSGLVNNIPSIGGQGSHFDIFKKNFALGIISALEKESKKRKLKPNRSDIESGLFIYNNTKMNAPYFNSQMKTVLINEEVVKPITNAMTEEWYNDVVKKNKEWIDEIYVRCAERTNKKDADEDRKAAKKLVKGKVAKLRDATSKDRSETILFLAEGDSAVSSMTAARDAKIHGILPLRGKIMNVSANGDMKLKELMESEALKDIMVSLNLVAGQKVVRDELRYKKLYISTDSDLDGLNIQNLICNFFYKFWPELFQDADDPFVYIFQTPFIILEKGKDTKYFYGHESHMFNPEDWKGWNITRAKGLGTLGTDDMRAAYIANHVIPIIDDGKMGETLDLIFNKKRADDRKDWMRD